MPKKEKIEIEIELKFMTCMTGRRICFCLQSPVSFYLGKNQMVADPVIKLSVLGTLG